MTATYLGPLPRVGPGAHVLVNFAATGPAQRGLRRLDGETVRGWAGSARRGIRAAQISADNEPAIALFRSLGFAELGRSWTVELP